MERRKFTREYKLEAVRLIKDRGVSYVQAFEARVPSNKSS
jgi:transposase-like protein